MDNAVIEQALIIDDLWKQAATGMAAARDVTDLLGTALAAHRGGDHHVVGEYLDRAMEAANAMRSAPSLADLLEQADLDAIPDSDRARVLAAADAIASALA